ncbi:MAG TPA: hypothetical protein VFQ79_11565 [Bryobacteraceae bacterium]|nr:hypothetical protein [Bryobacteraceae bacterium]
MNRREFVSSSLLVAGAAGSHAQIRTGFQAGYAERDITPAIGMEQPGGYGKSYHTKLHDPCKVRTAVFDGGATKVALVGVDAGSVGRRMVLAAREGIRNRCGIPADAVLIGASHSHSSGPIGGVEPGEYDHASALVRELAYEKSTVNNPKYVEHVQNQIVDAVCAAAGSLRPMASGVGSGIEDKVAFNRRFRMKNGLSYTHPGQGNPDIVKPAGPIDPTVGVIGSWDDSGKLAGCIVNYSCHATTNPGGISANWIYYMERTIRGFFGPDVVVVFLQGASGDVTQVDNLSPYRRASGAREAQFVGGRVGAEAVKVLLTMHPGELTPVTSASRLLRIKRRTPSAEKVKRAYQIVGQDPKEAGMTAWTFAKETVMLDAKLAKEPVADVEVQAIQVGPAVFLSNPAELFVEFGLEQRRRSRFPFTFPVELANGDAGYVPTEEALGPHGGGYETRLTSYSNLVPTAGRQMTEAGLELADRMQPGKVPEPPRAEPFKSREGGIGSEAWSYGNVPPELS